MPWLKAPGTLRTLDEGIRIFSARAVIAYDVLGALVYDYRQYTDGTTRYTIPSSSTTAVEYTESTAYII